MSGAIKKDPLTYHGECGKGWKQHGNRTGHCGGCHETFEGLAVFDSHQSQSPDGTTICANPETVVFRKNLLRLVGGTWRGPEMPKGVFKRESK